jgi:hypothetical protein
LNRTEREVGITEYTREIKGLCSKILFFGLFRFCGGAPEKPKMHFAVRIAAIDRERCVLTDEKAGPPKNETAEHCIKPPARHL